MDYIVDLHTHHIFYTYGFVIYLRYYTYIHINYPVLFCRYIYDLYIKITPAPGPRAKSSSPSNQPFRSPSYGQIIAPGMLKSCRREFEGSGGNLKSWDPNHHMFFFGGRRG